MTGTTDLNEAIQLRRLDHECAELNGRAVPPDRTAAILQRLRAEGPHRRFTPRQLAVAAVMLLGLCTTLAIALARRELPGADGGLVAAPVPPTVVAEATPAAAPASPNPPPAPTSNPRQPTHPKGTDPADLAAVRSAEAMLAAEVRLAAMRAEGKLPHDREPLDFATLSNWNYTNGLDGMPPSVRSLDGTPVTMIGFMLPTDAVEDMTEFLLVDSLWACCYGTPPSIHGIVRCVMHGGATADYSFDPVMITGTLTVLATMADGYCVDIFQLHVGSIVPL